MSGIEELRDRVTDAVAHFGQINEQRATYGQRLVDLMNTIEGRIRDQLREIEEHKAKIAHHIAEMESQSSEFGRIDRENEQLHAMLHALLQAMEAGGCDSLAESLQELEQKASALTDDIAPVAPVAEEIAEPVAEIEDAIVEAPSEEPDDAAEAPFADEPADPVAEAEESEAPAAEAEEPAAGDAGSGSLHEIMARVSKLVEETEAAIATPEPVASEPDVVEPVAEAPEDPVEEPAQQAAAGS